MFALLAFLLGLFQITDIPLPETPIETMPPDPFGPGDGLPPPDTPFVFQGTGAQAAWSDVYDAAQKDYRSDPQIAAVTQPDAGYLFTIHGDQVAIRAMLRAVSGFVNRAYSDATQNTNLLSTITDAEINDIVGRINRITRVVNQIGAEVNAIVQLAIPSLQAQITKLATDIPNLIQYAALSERNWVIENIFKPLYAEILKVQPAIDTAVAHEHTSAITYTDAAVAALGVNVLRALAPIATAVKTLQAESEQCTQPMCQTMGPKTPLGNLLKGIEAALAAGALAELANAKESDFADAIGRIGAKAFDVFNTLDSTFVQSGGTVADLVAAELKNLI